MRYIVDCDIVTNTLKKELALLDENVKIQYIEYDSLEDIALCFVDAIKQMKSDIETSMDCALDRVYDRIRNS